MPYYWGRVLDPERKWGDFDHRIIFFTILELKTAIFRNRIQDLAHLTPGPSSNRACFEDERRRNAVSSSEKGVFVDGRWTRGVEV